MRYIFLHIVFLSKMVQLLDCAHKKGACHNLWV